MVKIVENSRGDAGKGGGSREARGAIASLLLK